VEPDSGPRIATDEHAPAHRDPERSSWAEQARSRSQRQAWTFLVMFGIVLLIGLVAAGNYLRWWTIGGDTAQTTAATLCPAQSTADPADVQVNVLNGTQREGLAAGVARTLNARSFDVVMVTNADHPYSGVAEIRYGADGGTLAVHTLALELNGKVKLVRDDRTGDSIDLVLGKGYRSMKSTKTAAAAIKLKRAPAGCLDSSQ
jgi:hypothetical protein